MRPAPGRAALALLALASPWLAGCNKKLSLPAVVNQRPEVTLTQAPVATSRPYFYSYEVRWTGFDPDGRVDHYLLALDPVPDDTAWTTTTDNRRTFLFASGDPESLGTAANPGGYHTLVLKAVDNQGLASAPAVRSFFSYTVAPEVKITQPVPNKLLHPVLPPTVTFRWTGFDPDGIHSRKPVKYKFHMFQDGVAGFSVSAIGAFFDSLRHAYPPGFPGWDSTITDTSVQIKNLVPSGTYVFALTCFDEAGAYDPTWSFDTNLLYFFVDYPVVYGPKITMFNEFFSYTYLSPGYLNVPGRYVFLEVPVSKPLTIHWSADPGQFASMKDYRWAMDIQRLDDNTPRSGPDDLQHWSFPSLFTTQATIGPFASSDSTHLFYLEAEDNNGLKSLGILSLKIVKPDFHNELLFVNDLSFPPDQTVSADSDSLLPPSGFWPTFAEIDTFLYARGGVRWRMTPNGTLSPPGIFLGYQFDTLSVRQFYNQPFVPLSTLARYRHVVWMTDQAGDPGLPIPGLRYMSSSSQQNTLATYAGMGGQVWLLGGGAAYNSLINFDVRSNNTGGLTVFSPLAGELVPGRMMFDQAHWQSEITIGTGQEATRWSGLTPSWPGAPDYSSLPSMLLPKSPLTDPLWPYRRVSNFYLQQGQAEWLSKPNNIIEDLSTDPTVTQLGSALDTLYIGSSGHPIMTYYHGRQSVPFVFSGFPLWFFQRPAAIQLADWVLQGLWHLPREPLPRGPGATVRLAPPAPPAPAPPAGGAAHGARGARPR